MKRSLRTLALMSLFVAVAVPAQAATILLSGDSNIVNGIDGSGGGSVVAGNSTFFSNILGAGTNVLIHDNCGACGGSLAGVITTLNTYYGSLGGVTSNTHSGAVTGAALSGVNLFVSVLPANDFSASELSALASFGGDIIFLGENGAFTTENNRINAALAGLGSSMSLLNNTFDGGFHTATGAQIAADPYTAGITSFLYAAPSAAMVSGGTALFFGTGQEPFVAYEGAGQSVPEPTTLLLLGLGLCGVAAARRFTSARK